MRAEMMFLIGLLAAPAVAQTIYKCNVGGRIQYTDVGCANGPEVKRMAPDGGPTPEDRARAQMRMRDAVARQQAEERDASRARQEAEVAHAARMATLERETRQRSETAAENYENEKILTHDISGWDRKPRGQVAAEQAAREAARAQARAGAPLDLSQALPPAGKPAGWQSQGSMTHSISGWSAKSRSQQVTDAAKRAYQDELDDIKAEQRAAARAAQAANSVWDNDGPRYVRDQKGQNWRISGREAVNDQGRACPYHPGTQSISCP